MSQIHFSSQSLGALLEPLLLALTIYFVFRLAYYWFKSARVVSAPASAAGWVFTYVVPVREFFAGNFDRDDTDYAFRLRWSLAILVLLLISSRIPLG